MCRGTAPTTHGSASPRCGRRRSDPPCEPSSPERPPRASTPLYGSACRLLPARRSAIVEAVPTYAFCELTTQVVVVQIGKGGSVPLWPEPRRGQKPCHTPLRTWGGDDSTRQA